MITKLEIINEINKLLVVINDLERTACQCDLLYNVHCDVHSKIRTINEETNEFLRRIRRESLDDEWLHPSPILCEHANECPSKCQCSSICYCRIKGNCDK